MTTCVRTGKRHPFLFRYDVGFDDDGAIKGLDLLLAANGGHVADHTPAVMTRALCHSDNCYWLPAVRFLGLSCKTNTVSNTAFRGYGGPQGMFGIETIIDIVARHLGVSLEDVRQRNYYGDGQQQRHALWHDHRGQHHRAGHRRSGSQRRPQGVARERRRLQQDESGDQKGLATMPVKFGISFNRPALNQAGALVHVYMDGSVTLNHGGTEMGQGLFIKVAQVVAETFQIDIDNIRITATTTGKVPNTSPTAASSGSDLNGMAARNAAEQIKDRMADVAARSFQCPEGGDRFLVEPHLCRQPLDLLRRTRRPVVEKRASLSATGFYRTPKVHWDMATASGRPFYYFTYGVAAAEVAIDTLTGEMRVLRAEMVQDCGESLNPAIDLGQIEGAFVQGMGWLTSEELVWDEKGRLRTHGPSTYKIPGSRDVPPVFNVRLCRMRRIRKRRSSVPRRSASRR